MAMTSPPASFRSDSSSSGTSGPGASRFRVGLTGGIGSGKSLVANEFSRLGAHVVDADAVAHTLTAPGGNAIEPIRARFGIKFIDENGALNRTRMRDLVFRDASAKKALEQILHPMIRAEVDVFAEAAPATTPYLVLSIPLLIESGKWNDRVDRILVIDCTIETQIARVMLRNGLARSAARSIIANQATRKARLDAADDVLVNESSADEARRRVIRLHTLYGQHGQAPRGDAGSRVSL
jgi:dephospho-CoA kinase